jgi:hypothetical protein
MVRGLRSQLSPKEESTLVELRDGVWLLTDLGTQRLSAAA